MSMNEIGIRLKLDGERQVRDSMQDVEQSVTRLSGALQRVGHYGAAFFGLQATVGGLGAGFLKAADSVTVLNNQLRLATGSTQAAVAAYESLFNIAQRSRVSFTELGSTFASISRAGEALGLSQQRLLGVTEAISNAVAVSGGSAESAKAALVQLAQGLSSGTLRGDELNSVMEQTPRLAKALADGLGVTTGELRKLGEQGKITANAVIRSLESQSSVLKDELATSVQTVAQSWTQLQNAALKSAGALDAATGATASLSSGLQSVAGAISDAGKAITENKDAIQTSMGALSGAATAAGLLAVAANIGKIRLAFVGLAAAAAANPVGLALVAVGAAIGGISAYTEQAKGSIDGIKSEIKELERLNALAAASPHDAILNANVQKRTQKIKELTKALDDLEMSQRGYAGRGQVNPDYVTTAKAADGPDKAERERALRELELQKKLMADLSGLSSSFYDDWERLNRMFAAGGLSVSQLSEAQAELLSRQPAMRDAAKEAEKAQRESAKVAEESAKAYSKVIEAGENDTQRLREQVAAEAQRVATIGMSTEALAEYTAAQIEDNAASLERRALAYEFNQLGYEQAQQFREQAALLREQARLKRAGAAKESAQEAAREAQKAAQVTTVEWRRAAEKIQDSITDALMRGFESGKGFAENLRDTVVNMFKTMVLRPIVEFGVRGGLSMLGMGGLSGAANAASAVSGAANGASMLGNLSGWLTDFGGSVSSTISSIGRSIADLSEISGSYGSTIDSIGTSIQGSAAAVGQFATYAGYAASAFTVIDAASKGQWGRAIGAGAGAALGMGNPITTAIGAAIGGWVDDAFGGGHEYTTGTGISGKFSGSNFAGRNYQDWRNDGSSGFFGIGASGSSSGTNYSAMGAAQQKSLGLAYGNLLAQTAGFATALGANAASITGYQKDIKLALGTDAEANKKAIAAMFKGIADDVAATVLDSRFMREGEGAADTLARLATNLTTVNGALDTLGDNLLTVSQSSGDAASSLVDAFGGLQAYQSAIGTYYQRFYNQEERLAKTREQLTRQMAGLGLSVPDSTAAFRELVNAQDLSTEAGRKTYAALIGMSSAFAEITDAAQAAQLKLSDVAKSLQTLLQSVTSARESVASARNEVNPTPVMDAASIRAAVLAATTSASAAAMNAAAQDLGAKTVAASQASATLTTAQTTAEAKAALLTTAVTDNAALVAKYKTAATTAQNLATGYGMSINSSKATSTFANDAYSYDPKTNQVNDFNDFGYRTWTNSLITKIGGIVVGSATTSYDTSVNKQILQNALRGNSPGYTYQPGSGTYEAGSLIDILSGANTKLAEQSKKIAEAQAASAAAQAALTTATTNKAAADAAAKAAATEYTKAVDAWTAEASKSVPQLTKLRDETLRYYEAQKALAEGMATSAANLRAAVAAARATQLDPLASAQQQQRDFAKNYALALSTTGAVQAGYADKLAAALPTLSDALKATQSTGDWTATMARLFAQSNAIADQLDANAPKDFQAESLGLLDSIDSALTVLDDSTRAITRAIEVSGGVTAAGLRAVVSTLGGVPSFDVGTNYVPRDMFARIHEGEAIVPKAYNPFRSGSMGAGLGDTSRLEALVEQQAQQLAALRSELRAITIHTANTAENTRSMDKNGVLVFNDPLAPIETKVVA